MMPYRRIFPTSLLAITKIPVVDKIRSVIPNGYQLPDGLPFVVLKERKSFNTTTSFWNASWAVGYLCLTFLVCFRIFSSKCPSSLPIVAYRQLVNLHCFVHPQWHSKTVVLLYVTRLNKLSHIEVGSNFTRLQ